MAAVAAALGIALAASQRTSRSADQVAALQTACAGEDPPACAELARRYRAGDGVARDLVKAVRAARDGCEAGEPALCVEAGRAILRGEGLKPDPELARRLFGDACTHRTRAGCLDLALMLQNGDGVAKDPAHATSLFDLACQGGEAAACSLYGDARYMGSGAPKDARAAEAAYRRACELELYSGCTKLGDLFRMRHEAARAAAQYRKACAADEKDACTALALRKAAAAAKLASTSPICAPTISPATTFFPRLPWRGRPARSPAPEGSGKRATTSRTCTRTVTGCPTISFKRLSSAGGLASSAIAMPATSANDVQRPKTARDSRQVATWASTESEIGRAYPPPRVSTSGTPHCRAALATIPSRARSPSRERI